MQPLIDATVFVVDDDAEVRDGLTWLLRSRRLYSHCFESAETFWAYIRPRNTQSQPQCLLLDVRMPGMSGLALFEHMVEKQWHLTMPVIFLTGHADVPTAVQAVKRGAFDFCEKPFSDNALVDRIEQALLVSQERMSSHQSHAMIQRRLGELTEREHHVMRLVVEGLPNKRIAEQLDISVRTVEVHRSRVFDKMQVKSAVELTNLLKTLPLP